MFKLIQIGREVADCTAPYSVVLGGNYTVGEFIRDVLLDKREWGHIGINCGKQIFGRPDCTYSNGELTSNLPSEFLDLNVVNASASGGWSRMDYLLTVEDVDDKFISITDHYGVRHENIYGDDCHVVYRIGDEFCKDNYIAKFKHRAAAINECKYLERCEAIC